MSLSTVLRSARESGWNFQTSGGGDAGVGIVALSAGFIDLTSRSPLPPQGVRARYAAAGAGLSISIPLNGDGSTSSMFSAGKVYTLTSAPLQLRDFSGGCILLSAGSNFGPFRLMQGGSASILLFGASAIAFAAWQVTAMASMVPVFGAPAIIPNFFLQREVWSSFKGLIAMCGANRGFGSGPGFALERGYISAVAH